VLRPLDEAGVCALVPELRRQAVSSVAVGFLHSYVNPTHEQRVREILLASLPHLHVTLSSEVCPEIREYERLSTTCANAYVQPLMARYLDRLREQLEALGLRCPMFMMSSGGGLMPLDAAVRFPVRLMESGPAGGAILACQVAAERGLDKVMSFDMGGTTAKVCLIEQCRPQTARSFEVDRADRFLKGSGLPLRIPVIEMIEIGAGGGSIAGIDELQQIVVGPHSAGADPGPACYPDGGEHATVTDADLVLGRIDPNHFANGQMALEPARAEHAIDRAVAGPLSLTPCQAAYGICEMVEERMANAARVHAIERGKVIGEHTIVAFGGAAPLHAARLAEKLAITRIVVPTSAGVGSAVGFLRAPVAFEVVTSHYMRLQALDAAMASRLLRDLAEEARAVVRAGAPDQPLVERRSAFMRYVGQGHEILVPLPPRDLEPGDAEQVQAAFDVEYRRLYARVIPDAEVEILSWVVHVGTSVETPAVLPRAGEPHEALSAQIRRVYDPATDAEVDVPVYRREELAPGAALGGPALIVEEETAIFVAPAFDAHVDGGGDVVLERRETGRER
jgi:N-methylhydantoinase A